MSNRGRGWIAGTLALLMMCVVLAGCDVGADPGMFQRCIFGTSHSLTLDCPGTVGTQASWQYNTDDASPEPLLVDKTNGVIDYQAGTDTHRGLILGDASTFGMGSGRAANMYIDAGINTSKNPAGETNLKLWNWGFSAPLHGLHSHHTIYMYRHSGYYNVEYGIWFTSPANNLKYHLSVVLPPSNPNTSTADPHVIFKCNYCAKNITSNNVKLDGKYFGFPNIFQTAPVDIDINWEALVQWMQNVKGWWKEVDPNTATAYAEEFQPQAWAIGSPTAGGVATVQSNWRISN